MKKKIRFKMKSKSKKINYLLVILLLILFCSWLVIDFIGTKLGKSLIEYAEVEAGRIARYVVNYAVTTKNIKELTFDDLFIVNKNSKEEIQTVDFDPIVVNNVLNSITETVIMHFKAIEEGNLELLDLTNNFFINTNIDKLKQGIIAEVPVGVVTGNALLSNLGPKLPVKLAVAGEIESQLETEIKYYGINNALISVYVNIKVSEQIYMPIATGKVVITQKIPIGIKLMQGIVPNAYFSNLDSMSVIREISK